VIMRFRILVFSIKQTSPRSRLPPPHVGFAQGTHGAEKGISEILMTSTTRTYCLRSRFCSMGTQWNNFAHTNIPSSPSYRVSYIFGRFLPSMLTYLGLLHSLQDCGSPPLASRAANIKRPNELRTSDRKSLLAYLGLPLDIFGKVCIPRQST
jgi:hypothetical protein